MAGPAPSVGVMVWNSVLVLIYISTESLMLFYIGQPSHFG